MIRNLRKKFILINMGLLSIVLFIVFSSICFFSYNWMKGETYKAMEGALRKEPGKKPPILDIGDRRPERPGPIIPMFSALLDESGDIVSIAKENVTVTDEMVEKLVERVNDSGKQDGVMFDLKLRFIGREVPDGTKIIFADMGSEIDSMANLVFTLMLVGFGGMAAFFFISFFLSDWALRPAEKAWKQQRRFVADASHELRTPLTVILANTGILLSHMDDTIKSQAKWIENTQVEASRMKKLVDDLLFLAKSDAAQIPPVKALMSLSDAVWSCLLTFEPLAYEQSVSVESEIVPDISFEGDEGQIKQLIVILLDNACKYAGENGKVTVALKRVREQVCLSVRNTGEPIPAEHLGHIFERFYRSDSSRVRKEGGYGLGLAIAKKIAENHNGNISVRSDKKSGTVFEVCFPNK